MIPAYFVSISRVPAYQEGLSSMMMTELIQIGTIVADPRRLLKRARARPAAFMLDASFLDDREVAGVNSMD